MLSTKQNPPAVFWSLADAQQIDAGSIASHPTQGLKLMEAAGIAVANTVQRCFGRSRPVLVLAGTGNNGGDGLVAAFHLYKAGHTVHVIVVGEPSQGSESFCHQYQRLRQEGLEQGCYTAGCLESLKLKNPVAVDALIGLGLKQELRSSSVMHTALLECGQINGCSVVAVDIPSGLAADHWQQTSPLAADMTVTFGAKKPCHLLQPSRASCGEVVVADIGFDSTVVKQVLETRDVALQRLTPEVMEQNLWPHLQDHSHKFQRGHVLIVGGSQGKIGAPLLAAHGALAAGAGWVSLALSSGYMPVTGAPLEVTYEGFFAAGELQMDLLEAFIRARHVKALVIGPGTVEAFLSADHWQVLAKLSQELELRIIADAGALHGFWHEVQGLVFVERLLITPHPGEWQKSFEQEALNLDDLGSVEFARGLAQKHGVVICYKTSTALVVSPQAVAAVDIKGGCHSLAKAGMGDVLAGFTAGTALGGCALSQVAGYGLCALNLIGVRWLERYGSHGLTPMYMVKALKTMSWCQRRELPPV